MRSGAGVHTIPRFVDGDHGVVLIQDVERNIFGDGFNGVSSTGLTSISSPPRRTYEP